MLRLYILTLCVSLCEWNSSNIIKSFKKSFCLICIGLFDFSRSDSSFMPVIERWLVVPVTERSRSEPKCISYSSVLRTEIHQIKSNPSKNLLFDLYWFVWFLAQRFIFYAGHWALVGERSRTKSKWAVTHSAMDSHLCLCCFHLFWWIRMGAVETVHAPSKSHNVNILRQTERAPSLHSHPMCFVVWMKFIKYNQILQKILLFDLYWFVWFLAQRLFFYAGHWALVGERSRTKPKWAVTTTKTHAQKHVRRRHVFKLFLLILWLWKNGGRSSADEMKILCWATAHFSEKQEPEKFQKSTIGGMRAVGLRL